MNPIEEAMAAAELVEEHRLAMAEASCQRALAICRALEDGMSQVEVARRLGVSPQAVNNLLRRVAQGSPDSDGTGRVER